MSSHRGHRHLLLVTCGALACALLAPALAEAAVFKGKSDQGKTARVVVDDAEGLVEKFEIDWKADCERPKARLRTGTVFGPSFDTSTPTRFASGGKYRDRDGRYKLKFKVKATGERRSAERWAGEFNGKAVIKRNGRVYDRCRSGPVRWSATGPR